MPGSVKDRGRSLLGVLQSHTKVSGPNAGGDAQLFCHGLPGEGLQMPASILAKTSGWFTQLQGGLLWDFGPMLGR